MVSRAQIESYRRDGLLVVPGFVTPGEVESITRWTEELGAAPEERGGVMKYHEEGSTPEHPRAIGRIEYFRRFHAGLRDFMERGAVPEAAGALLGEPATLFKDKINLKGPGSAAFEPHQDAQAGWLRYCDPLITVMISIDRTHLENGCLELAAGHHRRGLIGALWRPLTPADLDGVEFRPYLTQPGDAIFFDCYTPHRSGPNQTALARRVLYLTYNARAMGDHYETYFAIKRSNLPPDCEREPGREYHYQV